MIRFLNRFVSVLMIATMLFSTGFVDTVVVAAASLAAVNAEGTTPPTEANPQELPPPTVTIQEATPDPSQELLLPAELSPEPTATTEPTMEPTSTASPEPTATPEPTPTNTPEPTATTETPTPTEMSATLIDVTASIEWIGGPDRKSVV